MNDQELEDQILNLTSKHHTQRLAGWAGEEQSRVDRVVKLFLNGSPTLSQRASWILSKCAEQQQSAFEPHIGSLLEALQKEKVPNGVKRNVLRIFNDVRVPEEYQGLAADRAFTFLSDANEPIAVRVFAMTVLLNIGKEQPDLLPELRLMVEDMIPYGSAGIKSRGRRTLKTIDQILKQQKG